MLIDVKVPQLSEYVAEATLVSWHKQEGQAVSRDENLIDIETDKVVLELPAPDDGVLATGSGGNVALGAARALLRHAELPLEEVCRAALAITGEIDLYTNDHVTVLSTGARSAP